MHLNNILVVVLASAITVHTHSTHEGKNANVAFNKRADDNGVDFEIGLGQDVKLKGTLGLALPLAVGTAAGCPSDPGVACIEYGDFANLTIYKPEVDPDNCARIEWESTHARELEDCFDIEDGVFMYGGGETKRQYWPINQEKRQQSPYVTGDFLQNQEFYYGGVVENYWLFSTGVAIHVDEDNPLFVSYDTDRPKQLCFRSADQYPYKKREKLTLKYSLCVDENLKKVHQKTMNKFFEKPTEIPDEAMLTLPFWCTWAQYKTEVNQTIVLDYAKRVISEGFQQSSHIEIDDNWESCYGMEEFNLNKFPNPAAMVQEINAMNLRVTVWIHPFINFNCPLFETGVNEGFFLKDPKGKTGITSWWQGGNSGMIDMTNENAVTWWKARLQKLKTDVGISAFKFDAGEVNWLPYATSLTGDENLAPNLYTTKYIDALSSFGGLVEARVARRNQKHAIFTRMLDKDSIWGYENGLKSMIPTLLHFSIVGYPFVLPDMIGGNAYGDWPSKELFIRWLQANIFMPSVQFSIVPWDDHFDAETVEISRNVLQIRQRYEEDIILAARQAVSDGSPINRPLWWVDPTDPETFTIDSEYMLGDNILVAPVLEEGATSRDIYFPAGSWTSGVNSSLSFTGPIWVRNHPAPLSSIPFFVKSD